jgi:hypothetical protein
MEVNKRDIEFFSNQLLNIKTPPVLWNSIRIDGNCFFHAVHYAHTGKLLPKSSNKIIELRQKIVSTMKHIMISGVTYEEFMNARKNGKPISWPYSENDVVAATAKYYKKAIIVISMDDYGGVTIFRPKGVKIKDPLFLICTHMIHFVPFHSDKVQITNVMRNRLEQIEEMKREDNAIIEDDDVYSISFLLKDLLQRDSLSLAKERLRKTKKTKKTKIKKSKSKTKSIPRGLTRKETHSHSRSLSKTRNVNKQIQILNDERLAKRMQQINANYEYAKQLQGQY